MAVGPGNGSTIVFGTSSFSFELLDLDGPELLREMIRTSHMGTTTEHTKVPDDLSEVGEVSITGHFNGSLDPPINGALETVTVDWAGDGMGNTWAASMAMTRFRPRASMGEMMTFEATLEGSGGITVA